jgi:hypothetical protein
MIRWLVMVLAAWSGTAVAETARVISGEHADFTRLVVELPEVSDWTVGRMAMGYGFVTRAPVQPGYDLSRVWDRIPRTRLQALRVDPASGALLLTLACDCHVFPFEYQPGMVVLDIRAGPAPPASAFEAALTLPAAPQPRSLSPLVPVAASYDWLRPPRDMPRANAGAALPLSLGKDATALAPLRDELLLQLSRGAANGVVDMVLPGKPVTPEVEGMGDLSGALIRIGELPGLDVRGLAETREESEDACIPDTAIDLSGWGNGRPALDLLAEARAGLYEEFDVPSPKALVHAVRLHLYLGFGAEARQYGMLLDGAGSDPVMAPLLSMARLIDGDPDPTSPFLPMAGCDGAGALWAVLAQPGPSIEGEVNTDAVVRSFQALPAHLRRHLGPGLASRLLDRDPEAARMIRDAFERTPDVPAGTVALMDAEAELQASRPDAALDHAEKAVEADGSGLAALVALVEAHFQSGKTLSSDVAASLMALRDIASEDLPRHGRAEILALALSGQVDAAFDMAGPDSADLPDLWRVVAQHADDNAFLARAVLTPAASVPVVEDEVELAIADRLVTSGFHDAALLWLGPVAADAPPERRTVAARAQLALGNARAALLLLSGLTGAEVPELQAAAYRQIGAFGAARQALTVAGNVEEGARLAAWGGDWGVLADEGTTPWAAASALARPGPTAAAGPLAEGRAALEDSAAARSAISALLAEVPSP